MKKTTMILVSLLVAMAVAVKGSNPECNECFDYLVSVPRGVEDSQLTASSTYPNQFHIHDPHLARLYYYKNGSRASQGWSALNNDRQQFIQVAFSQMKIVKGIKIQGRENSDNINQWVTKYSVTYSLDNITWTTVKDVNGTKAIFDGNNGPDRVVATSLPECVKAKFLRLHPEFWNVHISLRFDVIGCSAAALKNREYEIDKNTHMCYKFYTWNTDAASALGVCSREKARLLEIHHSNQMVVLQDIITNNLILSQQSNFFVDGSYENATWKYSSNKDVPSALWSSGNPYPAVGSCVTITVNGLESHNCNGSLYFVCGI